MIRCKDYYVSDLHDDSCKECKRLNKEYRKQKRQRVGVWEDFPPAIYIPGIDDKKERA